MIGCLIFVDSSMKTKSKTEFLFTLVDPTKKKKPKWIQTIPKGKFEMANQFLKFHFRG